MVFVSMMIPIEICDMLSCSNFFFFAIYLCFWHPDYSYIMKFIIDIMENKLDDNKNDELETKAKRIIEI